MKITTSPARKMRKLPKRRTVGWKRVVRPKTPRGGISKLKKTLDALFSRYTRIRASDANGNVSCYTCGHRNHYKKMQAGHYISRFYLKTRWSESNVRVQCVMCNMWKNGDIATFRKNLVAEIGADAVSELETTYKEITKLTPEFYEERIKHFTELIHTLGQPIDKPMA